MCPEDSSLYDRTQHLLMVRVLLQISTNDFQPWEYRSLKLIDIIIGSGSVLIDEDISDVTYYREIFSIKSCAMNL